MGSTWSKNPVPAGSWHINQGFRSSLTDTSDYVERLRHDIYRYVDVDTPIDIDIVYINVCWFYSTFQCLVFWWREYM